MTVYFPRRVAVLALVGLVALPSLLEAQRGRGPGAGRNPIAPLIDLRRELNLTPRQLVQLDSIERALIETNRALMAQYRGRTDSLPRMRRGQTLTDEQRAELRAQFEARRDSMRARRSELARNDSIARERAMAVLTDSQRVQVREWQAEQRGFARGRAMGQRPGFNRGFRGRPGGPPGRFRPPRGR
ncbi:MAG TPA: hypothetical protein VF178_02010 [Gemmatimonadaceae bacterium]